MKQLMSVLLVSVAATACVNLNGQLDVKQPLNAKIKSGFLHLQTKDTQIQPGIYDVSLSSRSDKKILLKIKPQGTDQKEISIPIKGQEDLDIPSVGEFKLSSGEIGQPFDVVGSLKTEYSESSRERILESCTITRFETHCFDIGNQPSSGQFPPQVNCTEVTVSIPGEKVVEYHTAYTSRDATANFINPQTKDVLAELTSSGTESHRVTDFEGPCLPQRFDPHHP